MFFSLYNIIRYKISLKINKKSKIIESCFHKSYHAD